MKALTWQSRGKITCETVPDPKIEHGRDVIIKVTACAICGSDLHLMGRFMPTMECGDILGHETIGEDPLLSSINATGADGLCDFSDLARAHGRQCGPARTGDNAEFP